MAMSGMMVAVFMSIAWPGSGPLVRPAANSMDMVAKGRSARQLGASNAQAILTKDQVEEIKADSRTATAIASALGVARSTISMIRAGRNWTHV